MEDGKPIYASHDDYTYDDMSLNKVRENRDPRLTVFLKVPGQVNCFKNMDYSRGDRMIIIEPQKPDITNGSSDWAYTTGYALRKGERLTVLSVRCLMVLMLLVVSVLPKLC